MKKTGIILFLLSLIAFANATVVLNETFDTDSNQWLTISQGVDSIYGGKLHMASTGSQGVNWLVNGSVDASNFTLSVETAILSSGENGKLGISFRTQDNTDAYQFYIYPAGYYYVVKYQGGTYTDFSNGKLLPNTFISRNSNTLKVVGNGDTFSFLCNGQLLTTITDNALSGAGKFGVLVTGILSAEFDNLIINDEAVADPGLRVFQDDFSSTALLGWANYAGLGTFSVQSNKLQCVAANVGSFSTLVSHGDFGTEDTISVITEKVTPLPTSTNLFGILFHHSTVSIRDTLRNRGYIFCILNGGYYALLRLSNAEGKDTTYTLVAPTPSLTIQNAAINTLKVINSSDGKKDLYVNGTKVTSFTDNAFASGGVGLIGLGGVTVKFDDFRVAAKQDAPAVEDNAGLRGTSTLMLTAQPNPFSTRTILHVNGATGSAFKLSLYDAQGKRVAKWAGRTPTSLTWDAGVLPPGLYFARLVLGTTTLTRQLVLLR